MRITNIAMFLVIGTLLSLWACGDPKNPFGDEKSNASVPGLDPKSDPIVVEECVGSATVEIDFRNRDRIPDKVLLKWSAHGVEVLNDECSDDRSRLKFERRDFKLALSEGGFGYTPPEKVTIEVYDRGACDRQEKIFEAKDIALSVGSPVMCASIEHEVLASDHFVFDQQGHDVDLNIAVDERRSCYSAADELRECSSVNFWNRNIPTSFPVVWTDSKEGQYWFCPKSENCKDWSADDVASSLCKFAEQKEFPLHVSVRSICSRAVENSSGFCCFGVDAGILYD